MMVSFDLCLLQVSSFWGKVMECVSPVIGEPLPFSEAVKRACEAGYADRKMYDDMGGIDMARKVLYNSSLLTFVSEIGQQ
jgi:hypothetical protein